MLTVFFPKDAEAFVDLYNPKCTIKIITALSSSLSNTYQIRIVHLNDQSKGTIGGHKLVSAEHTLNILSIIGHLLSLETTKSIRSAP